MKKHCQFLFISAFLIAVFSGTSGWAAPSIHFPEKEWDWGEYYSGEKIVHVFTFENKGDQTLQILNVSTSCGCTAALISEKNIAPGGTGKIEVIFDTKGYRNRAHKVVYLSTNDPSNKQVQLRIHGNIRLDLIIQPRSVFMGFRERDKILSRTLELSNMGDKNIRILKILPQIEDVKVEIEGEQNIEPGKKLKVPLSLKAPEKGNRFASEIIIQTDHPRHKEIKIPVRLQFLVPIPQKQTTTAPFLEKLRQYKEQQEQKKAGQNKN